MGVVIYADAGSNLFNSILEEKNLEVKVLAMTLDVDGKSMKLYDEIVDPDSFSKEFYGKMRKGCKVKTALVNTGLLLEEFEKQTKLGNQVICYTMSKNISGTYQSAVIAATEINEKFDKPQVHVIDSLTSGLGEGLQALRAAEDAKAGLPFEEIVKRCEDRVQKTRSEFMVDDAKYLAGTGRVSPLVAKIASVLNIKVVLNGSSEGKIEMVNKVHGKMMGIKTIANYVINNITDKNSLVFLTHCDAYEDAEKIKKILFEHDITNVEIQHHEFVTGAHIGPGSIAAFYEAANRNY